MERKLDLVCLGEGMVELNQRDDGAYEAGFGGDTSNVAIAAARQGARVGYLTRIGTDPFGDSLLDLWREEGIDIGGVIRDPSAPTASYFVTHHEDGHRFSYMRKGSAASLMNPGNMAWNLLQATGILHLSGISQAISNDAADACFMAIDAARAHGATVSYDPNLRLSLWPLRRAAAITHAAMASCDIALPGFDDAVRLTGRHDPDGIADFYLDLGAGIVALTLGSEGALVATRSERARIPALDVPVVDATGAGDTFDGAFLAEYAAGRSPFEAAAHANRAAAHSVQRRGAVNSIPRRRDLAIA